MENENVKHGTRTLLSAFRLTLHGIFIDLDPLLGGYSRRKLADEVERNVFGFGKSDAAFAHVELFLAVFWPFFLKPLEMFVAAVEAH